MFDSVGHRGYLNELLDVISDLIHKVEEFEPEEITEDDVNKYYREEGKSLLSQGIERDKLAKELVETILGNRQVMYPSFSCSNILHLAEQLKEKLNATE